VNGRRALSSLTRSSDECEHLRKRVDQQERSLAVLVQAVSALRSANAALREQNRDLQIELQRARRAGQTARDAVHTAAA
jgi:regulator of replication initiation timing